MSGHKPTPDEHKVIVPATEEFRESERDIRKLEIPFSEPISTTMQAPDEWPSPPDDVESGDR